MISLIGKERLKMAKRVLINTYNNDGIVDFTQALEQKYGYDIVATDVSYDYLCGNGISATKFDRNDAAFDIVVCNFYPFEKLKNKETEEDEVLNLIDTQGLSLLQKAAKAYKTTLSVSSPKQYEEVLKKLEEESIDENYSRKLAQKATLAICKVNSALAAVLGEKEDTISFSEEKIYDLTYGENPHQKASLYTGDMVSYEVIANKKLSYNNILDIDTATAIAAEFYDVCAVVITRHAMPCAVALGSSIEDAYNKAVDCDPISAFGGIAAFTKKIDAQMTKKLSSLFLEIIIAPDFDEETIETLANTNVKLIKLNTPLKDYKAYLDKDIKITPFGTLVQEYDKSALEKDSFKLVSKKKPTTEIVEDMVFAWKVTKHARSNAAVVVKDLRTVGISQGQANRLEAIDIALDKACENSKDAILATDGFISSIESIQDAAQGRIAAIIQPGGSPKDKEIIKTADKYELTMIMTGIRQFKNR